MDMSKNNFHKFSQNFRVEVHWTAIPSQIAKQGNVYIYTIIISLWLQNIHEDLSLPMKHQYRHGTDM